MCDLVTATIAASTLVGTAGTIQQGNAAQDAANYQAQVAERNREISEMQAVDAKKRGRVEETRKRRQTEQRLGAQRAAMAANGIDIDSGSSLDVLGDTAQFGELDALTIRSNTEREARGFRQQGQNFQSEANLSRARGSAAKTGSLFNAGSTLLTGASKGATSFKKFNG